MSADHVTLAQNLTDHLSSPTEYLKLDPGPQQRATPLLQLLTTGPNALKVARTTPNHLLSPMSNLRLGLARLGRKQKNYALAQELLIQVCVYVCVHTRERANALCRVHTRVGYIHGISRS